jgi:hypothetical protein
MLALLLADVLPVPRNFEFSPDPGPYIAIFGIGFMVAIVGHIAQSKFLIATGLLMIFSSIIVVPVAIYLGAG